MDPLSDNRSFSADLLPVNLWNVLKKLSTVGFKTIFIWVAQQTAHVNKGSEIYILHSLSGA